YMGFINRADKTSLQMENYKTSEGYKFVPWNQSIRNPEEAFRYSPKEEALHPLWNQLPNKESENHNHLFSVAPLNYEWSREFKIRARLSQDFTSLHIDTKNFSEYPEHFNATSSTGAYGNSSGQYSLIYGDLLATWEKNFNKDFKLSV